MPSKGLHKLAMSSNFLSSLKPTNNKTKKPKHSADNKLFALLNTSIPCPVHISKDGSGDFDSIVLVAPAIQESHFKGNLSKYLPVLQQYKQVDKNAEDDAHLIYSPQSPIHRVIFSPTGPLNRDYDDVRRISDAACKGIKRAVQSGSQRPLLSLPSNIEGYKYSDLVAILGALHALYVPIEVRESCSSRIQKASELGVTNYMENSIQKILELATSIESGRLVCRDIGGSDPERMAAPNVASHVQEVFGGTSVKVDIISDNDIFVKQYPLFAAVNRAAKGVERHQARLIFLTYESDGPIETTLLLVGKGVTYDTGGADIKAGGVMAGMHRDKCGAASVAGFFQVLAKLKPKGIKVIGGMAMVRNSVGSDCYVSDEIITSRAGQRVRVGNTDAEGRMAMTDVLCYMKELALKETNPYLFTIATLTGHAVLAVGQGYSIIMDNGPAKADGVAQSVQKAGDLVGDVFEISTLRREDYEFCKGKSEYEDLLQCNNLPSSRTPRGHQFPAAFMIVGAGLDKHGINSEVPLRYSHIDIAAADGPFPGIPSGSPVAALVSRFLFDKI